MTKNQEKPDILIQAEKLIDVSKLDEALKLLNNYERKEGKITFVHYLCHYYPLFHSR